MKIYERLRRRGQSQLTGNIIDHNVIDMWIDDAIAENGELEGYKKIEQAFTQSDHNVTQGMFAVDDLENPTRYFVVDVQQLVNGTETRCAVAGVEIDMNGNPVSPVDIHQEYGTALHVKNDCQVTVNGTRVFMVYAKNVQMFLQGDFEAWGKTT